MPNLIQSVTLKEEKIREKKETPKTDPQKKGKGKQFVSLRRYFLRGKVGKVFYACF